MSRQGKIFLVGASASSIGKTTLTNAFLASFSRAGYKVQAFKAGPDYIDPTHHAFFSGRPSYNLDSFLMSDEEIKSLVKEKASLADITIIEGVMGFYDGPLTENDRGSAAYLARLLDIPVVLTVSAKGVGRSLAAICKGFVDFDKRVKFYGVAINQIASPRHIALVKEPLEELGIKVLASLKPNAELKIPERPMGLALPEELPEDSLLKNKLADWLEESLSLTDFIDNLPTSSLLQNEIQTISPIFNQITRQKINLAVARSSGIGFYQQNDLEFLENSGCKLHFFSPISDSHVPENCSAMVIGGGRVDSYAKILSENKEMLNSIKEFADCGYPIWAQGASGAILGNSFSLATGETFKMASLVPLNAISKGSLVSLGYRLLTNKHYNNNLKIKGHEFRHLDFKLMAGENCKTLWRAEGLNGNDLGECGFKFNNIYISPTHIYFPSWPNFINDILYQPL